MQQVAEKELRDHVGNAKWRRVTQGALVCIDPYTGHIKAMVGSVNPDFTKDQFNRAVQARRQPGSAFKAFVYSAAVDSGYDPNYRVSNAPVEYKGKPWPKNYSRGQTAASYTMTQAVAQSVNRCAVRMVLQVGIDQVIIYARMLGIKSPLDRNLALALGASGVTPLELCSAYGVFAANGLRAEPLAVTRINESESNQDGAIIERNRPIVTRVLSEETVELINQLFRAVVTSGTGRVVRSVANAHGKTGTTQDDRDAWFVGYTPQLVTAVWVGNDNYSPMKSVWGGTVCAPTWAAFMRKALETHKREHEKEKPRWEPDPEQKPKTDRRPRRPSQPEPESTSRPARTTVAICAESGMLATAACPTTYEVSYDAGSEPVTSCPIHGGTTEKPPAEDTPSAETSPSPSAAQPPPSPPRPGTPAPSAERYVGVTICVDSGQVANTYCPETITRQFLANKAPTRTCRLHRPPE